MILAWMALTAFAIDPDRDVRIFPEDSPVSRGGASLDGEITAPPVPWWTARLPGGRLNSPARTERSRPVVHDDRIYVGSAASPGLFVLSRRDGSVIDKFPATGTVASAAVFSGDNVFFADVGGAVFCYTIAGKLIWKKVLDGPVLTDPVVDGDQVYVATLDDNAVALSKGTGELVWQYHHTTDRTRDSELALYGRPEPIVSGKSVVFGFSDGALVGVDRVRGEEVFERDIGEGRYPDLVGAPVVYGTDLYVSGYFAPFVAFDLRTENVRWRLDRGAAAAAALYTGPDDVVLLLHPGTDGTLRGVVALTGAEKWTWESGATGALTTPVLTPAGALVGSSEGGLWLIDPNTGAVLWTYDDGVLLEGLAVEPTVAGRQVIFVTNAGRIHSLIVPKPGLGGAIDSIWRR